MTIFGNYVTGDDVEQWTLETVQLWFDTYLKEFELHKGEAIGSIPRPNSYLIAEDVEREGTDQLPTVVVVSPGLNGDQPLADGEGNYRAWWRIGVGIFASAATRTDTKRLVRQYGLILRMIMLQKQSLGKRADGVKWVDESYDDNFDFVDEQTISAGVVEFDVEVANVVNRWAGPVGLPDPDQPGSTWPTADEVVVEVKKEG